MKKLVGLYTALITPFDEKGDLDEEGLRENINHQIKARVDGVVALGTTGEAFSLTQDEKERIIKICKEEIKGQIHLIVGTGGLSTVETIQQGKIAKQLGADFLLSVCPYYIKPTQNGLFYHFSQLAVKTECPVILYNNPTRTGRNIDPQTTARLAEVKNIVGIKESTADFMQINALMELIGVQHPHFSLLAGDDVFALPMIALGASGIISSAANLTPKKIGKLCRAALEGDFKKAREVHYELLPLLRGLAVESNPIPIKRAMEVHGFPAGKCRMPLSELNEHQEKVLKDTLKHFTLPFHPNMC